MNADHLTSSPARDAAADPFPPSAYLVGAQKCATTFLANLLDQHPELQVSHPKEPDFFTVNRPYGLDWYRTCFPAASASVLLDASTSYSMAPTDPAEQTAANPTHGVPDRIAAEAPRARIVYVVRDPVARAYSAYWHDVRTGYEDRPFRDALAARTWYLDGSRYYFQSQRYIDRFGRERVLILQMSEVTHRPAETCARVWRFLGLTPTALASAAERPQNASHTYTRVGELMFRNPRVRRVTKPVVRAGRRLLPTAVYDRVRAGLTRSIPQMTAAEREVVLNRLETDMTAFAELTGIDYRPTANKP